jgi:two-component system, OmpR family, response regulator
MDEPTILIVDDDAGVREVLRDCLEPEGMRIREAANSTQMQDCLAREHIDLVTLDLMLGAENGLAVAGVVRSKYKTPIIMISGKTDTIDKVVGLELGADDYITKPFQLREVIARVRAVLRRCTGQPVPLPENERFVFDRWLLDPGKRSLQHQGSGARELTTAEFNLLETLVRRPHRVLSRDQIMDALKGHDWSPLDRSIDVLVGRLRRKIEPDPRRPTLIKAVRGVGYVLACEVKQL